MSSILADLYDRLFQAYGPQNWWPAQSPFEVAIGAILVQNTAWKNVEKAIGNLARNDLLSVNELHAVPQEELEELIRPAGYYRVKARRLRYFLEFLVDRYDGSLAAMFDTDLGTLRRELLGVHGVGRETADSILLYAGNLPSFVVDTYTHRVLARHGWIGFDAGYDEIKEHLEDHLPQDAGLYNEFHALLVRVGHVHCRKTPRCEGCPLAEMLPDGGILEPDG